MLKDLISPFLLRRLKADVNIDLPAKTEQVLFCPMTSEQRQAGGGIEENDRRLGPRSEHDLHSG